MLKKLRIKFIVLNMTTVALVLAVVFTAICVIDYQQSVGRVHNALDAALSHVPGDEIVGRLGGKEGEGPAGAPAQTQAPLPPEIGGRRDGEAIIPVAVYEQNADGSLTAVTTRTTASIADDVLAEAGEALRSAPDRAGTLDALGLFYAKRQVDGTTYLAFADTSAASGWQSLALTLAGVGVVALAAFFVISLFFSRWALRPVERAWEQQRRFVADASHELKTPLTVILANTSILLEHPERSVASESQWIESTQTEAERMQQLVSDLLLLAQLDAGKETQGRTLNGSEAFILLNFSDVVEAELLQFESVAFERGVQLEGTVEPQVQVRGDASRLHRLMATLLDNACKYADNGGSVTVTLECAGRAAQLAVHNTGPAIAPDDLPHVFDRFYRADKARTRDEGGYGLGLAIAQEIAEEHGGTISVTSAESTGTTFTVTLPLPPTPTTPAS